MPSRERRCHRQPSATTTRHQANLLGAEAPVVAAARRRPSAPFQRFDEQLQEMLLVVGGPAMCCGPAGAAAQRMLRLSGVLRPSGMLRPSTVLRPSNDAAASILQGVDEINDPQGDAE